MQKNGFTFQQLKFLSESEAGPLKLHRILQDAPRIQRLRELGIPLEELAKVDLKNFQKMLTHSDLSLDFMPLKAAPT